MFMCDGGRPRSFEAAAAEELNECGQFMRLDRSLSLSLSRCKEGRGKGKGGGGGSGRGRSVDRGGREARRRRSRSGIDLRPQDRVCISGEELAELPIFISTTNIHHGVDAKTADV